MGSSEIQRVIGRMVREFKVPVGGLRFPEVQGAVNRGAKRIPRELRGEVVRTVAEEFDPGTLGTVSSFEAFFATCLDFILP